jgi:ligand-binding sensor protein
MNAEYDNQAENIEEENQENYLIQEDQFENDDQYMLELQTRVAMMKNERKQAEKDSQLLFNRLRLLKGEEEKVIN